MTTEEARQWVQRIKNSKDDPEAAHSLEDELRQLVLQDIRKGHPDAQKLAEIALSTDEIDFPRWCA